jgi:hypothetical protein
MTSTNNQDYHSSQGLEKVKKGSTYDTKSDIFPKKVGIVFIEETSKYAKKTYKNNLKEFFLKAIPIK